MPTDRTYALDNSDGPQEPTGRRFVVAITGASGAWYAQRLISAIVRSGHEVHLAVTDYGKRLLHDELNMTGLDVHALAGLPEGADLREHRVFVHPSKDMGATIASGSFRHDGMIVMPCSSNTLGAAASGGGDKLVYRAMAVALKERLPLILCHRESPLNLIDIENMRTLTLAGAIIAPTNPAFYLGPKSMTDVEDFVVSRVLDLVHVKHELSMRWEDHPLASGGRDKASD